MSSPAALTACVLLSVALPTFPGCRKQADRRPLGHASDDSPRVTINGRTWYVEVAATPKQRYTGLAGRDSLAAHSGMLFVFPDSQVLSFCMRGCLIDLDIAFIDTDGRIVATYTMMVADDLFPLTSYSSIFPAQYALEIPAGALAAAGVKIGDKAIFAGKIPTPVKASPLPRR